MSAPSSIEFDSIIARAQSAAMEPADVAALAKRLAASGRQLTWGPGPPVTDLASTGGAGSLSTLLAPLELRRLGCRVVKLGVPGRPAGAIDVLGTVPGYTTRLDEADVRRVVDRCGYAHFVAGGQFAPMDAALFEYRRENRALAVPPLAAASILSKKIAVGAQAVGLDVRVGPHGNFGSTLRDARVNALLFCRAAQLVGIEAVAFLFHRSGPEQPWIGRGEALAAVEQVLSGTATGDLAIHAGRCFHMARVVAELVGLGAGGRAAEGRREAFEANLEAQGAAPSSVLSRVLEIRTAQRRPISAPSAGVVQIDMAGLRDGLAEAQRAAEAHAGHDGFADPAGLVLRTSAGNTVNHGDTLAEVRNADEVVHADLISRLSAAFAVTTALSPTSTSAAMEIVRA